MFPLHLSPPQTTEQIKLKNHFEASEKDTFNFSRCVNPKKPNSHSLIVLQN